MAGKSEGISSLQIETAQVKGIQVLRVVDRIDMYSANELREHCRILWDLGNGKLVIDLSQASYIDSSGVGVLLSLYTHAQKRSLSLSFCSASPEVVTVLKLTRLDGFLPLHSDVNEAVNEMLSTPETPAERFEGLQVDEHSPLFAPEGLKSQEFFIDMSQIRRLSNLIAQKAPHEIHEINLLEQQISELIKNGVRHGNKNDKRKKLVVSWQFTHQFARLVVEDEGEGFQNLEEWNLFYRERLRCHRQGEFDRMMDFLAFRTEESLPDDGGNAMFAAVEYWNQGVVYNARKNRVAVKRMFY